jgi:hypothetical protein
MELKSINSVVLSRMAISKESIQVEDLFVTPQFDIESAQDVFADVIDFVKANFKDLRTLNQKTPKDIRYLLNDDRMLSQFVFAALTYVKIDGYSFSITNKKAYGTMFTTLNVYLNLSAEASETVVPEKTEKTETTETEDAPKKTVVETPETVVPEKTEKTETETTETEDASETIKEQKKQKDQKPKK